MKMIGVGIDLIDNERILRSVSGEAFLRRIYTEAEREAFDGLPAALAGNFAVKEAVSKALGTGFRGFGPADIEVLRDDLGKPYVNLYGKASDRAAELGVKEILVSITDTEEYTQAIAFAQG